MGTATTERIAIPAGTWIVDEVHTKVAFAVKHMGVSTVRGEFRDFDGGLESTGDGGLRAHGSVRAASVSTNQEQRDEHLRSADFFDAEDYPEIRFESTAVERIDDESYRIAGELTIHGVTNPIELRAELGGVDRGPEGELRAGFELTGQLSRKDYGMRFNAAL
ncbi:MAG: YceI family protein, partial [Thermoleophilia bacterium]|nr:YceI family protein [Thermoleophilia bacterium]